MGSQRRFVPLTFVRNKETFTARGRRKDCDRAEKICERAKETERVWRYCVKSLVFEAIENHEFKEQNKRGVKIGQIKKNSKR